MPTEDDRRYPVEDLTAGWHFRSPLDRWETVTRAYGGSGLNIYVQVWTEQTGPDYAWRLLRSDRVHAVPPPPARFPRQPEVRVVDLSSASRPRIVAVATFADCAVPDMRPTLVTAERRPQRDGGGWLVIDYPGGDLEAVVTARRDKAGARVALRSAAAAHARSLGVPLCDRVGWHQHD
jgi:hypothetical protein